MTVNGKHDQKIDNDEHKRGASWSSGIIRLPTAPRVGGSNLGLSPSFSSRKKNRKTTNGSRQNEKNEGPRRSGEKKKKNRQAHQEWLRERLSVRLSKLIKW